MATAQELESLVVRLVGDGSGYDRVLKEAVRDTKVATEKIEAATDAAMAEQNAAMREAAAITRAAAKPTEAYAREVRMLDAHLREGRITQETYTRTLRKLNQEFGRGTFTVAAYGKKMQGVGRSMQGMGMRMALGVTLPVAGMVASFATFDDAMTKSTAIMSDVTDDLRKEMEGVAYSISRNSVTSAKELAESYYFLASAGLDARQSIAALPVVEKFAVAGAFDMAQATDLLTDAQSALGLTVKDAAQNMTNMLKVSDVLVKANTLANASVQQFSEALTNEAGAAIKQYNIDLEEGVAILAAYADQGIKANVAGSLFGRMTRLLIKAMNENAGVFKKLNIPYERFYETGKGLTDVIGGITRAVDGMGPGMKAATLNMLGFEARTQQAILPLLGLEERIRGYNAELKKAGGTTEEVANRQLKGFLAQMKMVWNRVKEVSAMIGDRLAPYIKWLGEQISAVTVWFRGLDEGAKKVIAAIVGIVAVVGPLLLAIGGMVGLMGAAAAAGWVMIGMFTAMALEVGLIVAAGVALLEWLGVMDVGFTKFVGSIRVGGYSISAYWQATVDSLEQSWEWVIHKLTMGWEGFVITTQTVWMRIQRGFYWAMHGINVAFWTVITGLTEALAWFVQGAMDIINILPFTDGIVADAKGAMDEMVAHIKRQSAAGAAHWMGEIEASRAEEKKAWAGYFKEVEQMEAEHSKRVANHEKNRVSTFMADAKKADEAVARATAAQAAEVAAEVTNGAPPGYVRRTGAGGASITESREAIEQRKEANNLLRQIAENTGTPMPAVVGR